MFVFNEEFLENYFPKTDLIGFYHVMVNRQKNTPENLYRLVFKDASVTTKSIEFCGNIAKEHLRNVINKNYGDIICKLQVQEKQQIPLYTVIEQQRKKK